MKEEEAGQLLIYTITQAGTAINDISKAFREPWEKNPGTKTRAVLGSWIVTVTRHLAAITILSEEKDLGTIAHAHIRQAFEIMLQVRYFSSFSLSEMEKLAEKVFAWGYWDWLSKMAIFKDEKWLKLDYQDITKKFFLTIILSWLNK